MRKFWYVLLITVLLGIGFAQDRPATSQQNLCTIQGTVVNGITQQPLGKVELRLVPVEETEQPAALGSYSDDQGRFVISAVPAGAYRLFAQRQGFLSREYSASPKHKQGTILALTSGGNVTGITVQLLPPAAITGTILDQEGEPAAGAHIEALQYSYVVGSRKLIAAGRGEADDRGQYRIHGLQPGAYYLRVAYAKQLLAADNSLLAYPPAFYPGVTSAQQAVAVQADAGSEVPVDFQLVPAATVTVRGTVQNRMGSSSEPTAVFLDPTVEGGSQHGTETKDGQFEIKGVVPGDYELLAMAAAGDEQKARIARLPLTVGRDGLPDVQVIIAPPATIRGHVQSESKLPLPMSALIVLAQPESMQETGGGLISGSDSMGSGVARVKADGTFELKGLQPDHYLVDVASSRPGLEDWYAKSVRVGNNDVTYTGFTVAPGSGDMSMNILVSAGGGSVEGTVLDRDKHPVSDATVVAVPEGARRRRWDLFVKATTDQNGHYRVRGLAPGEYELFAWDEVEDSAWLDPEFLKQYESAAHVVKLARQQHEVARLDVISTAPPPENNPGLAKSH